MKKKEKTVKTPSKYKLWKQEMKKTPKGKAILKLIYWGIFFIVLFSFLFIASSLSSNYEINNNYENNDSEVNKEEEKEIIPKTIKEMEEDLINKTYKYTYDIRVINNTYLLEGTKYVDHIEGYKSSNYNGNYEVIKYYLDESGIYEVVDKNLVLIEDFYQDINKDFLNLPNLFTIINKLTLTLDEQNYGYPVYSAQDEYYTYTLNINKDKNAITDISIVSIDGSITYLYTFSNIGEYANE